MVHGPAPDGAAGAGAEGGLLVDRRRHPVGESLLKVPLCALRIRTGQWIHDVTVRKERGQIRPVRLPHLRLGAGAEPGRYRCPAATAMTWPVRATPICCPPTASIQNARRRQGHGRRPQCLSQQGLLRRPAGMPCAVWHWTMPRSIRRCWTPAAARDTTPAPSTGRCGTPGRPLHGGDGHLKAILRRAAKRGKDVEFAVASSLSPAGGRPVYRSAAQLLPPRWRWRNFGGRSGPAARFYVVPSEKHLWELKQVLYDHPYPNEVKETPYEGFAYAEIRHVENRIRVLGQEDIHALFQMTPTTGKLPSPAVSVWRRWRSWRSPSASISMSFAGRCEAAENFPADGRCYAAPTFL